MNFFSRSQKVCQNEQIKSRKNFPVNLSPDKPETGFLFFRVVEEILIFCFFFSRCLNALSARKSEKSVETSRICFLSPQTTFSRLTRKVWQLRIPNSVFSGHSSKAKKSTFFLRKSARNCPPEKVVRSQKSAKPEKSVYVEKKDSSSKIFQYKSVSFFLFNYAR